jgi:hypothetical protein
MNGFEKGAEQTKNPEVITERQEGLERFSRLIPAEREEIITAADGDEEAAFWIALAFGHPELEAKLIEQFKKYKPHIANPESIFRVASPLLEKSSVYPFGEIGDTVQDPEARVDKLFSYFKPKQAPKRIIVVPADNLTSATSGRSWRLGENGYVVSHSTNPYNFDHETAHLIINPIVEGLGDILSEEAKKRILTMGAEKLQEKYGDDWYPMLCEELINTYKECVESNEAPETFESFQKKIQSISEEDFNKTLQLKDEGEKLRQMGIKTKPELLDGAREYYDRYVRNQLRDSLYEIYQEYNSAGLEGGFESILERDISEDFGE